MIALFTDFGLEGPYVGQMHAVCASLAPDVPVVDLFHDIPRFDVRAGAYLLPAYTALLPADSVSVAVVDPGVGGPRRALLARADERWFLGPDNGLFTLLARRARHWECNELLWRPARLSASFHGRDLFAPAAAMLARGERPACRPLAPESSRAEAWPDDWAAIVYIDRYGNAITGLRASCLSVTTKLRAGGRLVGHARVFDAVAEGAPFWYENSNGLVEIAANRASAADILGLQIGDSVESVPG